MDSAPYAFGHNGSPKHYFVASAFGKVQGRNSSVDLVKFHFSLDQARLVVPTVVAAQVFIFPHRVSDSCVGLCLNRLSSRLAGIIYL